MSFIGSSNYAELCPSRLARNLFGYTDGHRIVYGLEHSAIAVLLFTGCLDIIDYIHQNDNE